MKVMVFYRPGSEHARQATDYLAELERQHRIDSSDVELVDLDTREGASLASIYDVVAYPGMAVVDNSGAFVKMWSGELPLQNELMSYLFTS